MNSQFRPVLLSFISALSLIMMGANYSAGPSAVPSLPMPKDAAMIYNPGNGDLAGFRIVVTPNGNAVSIDGAGHGASELQPNIVQKFFADLAAVGPLTELSAGKCSSNNPADSTPTVEVSAAIIISWNGQHTPALSCVSDPRAVTILLDASTIQRALYVQAYRKRATLAYGAYSGGGTYQNMGYGRGGYGSDSPGFYFQQYSNGERFSAGAFTNSRFDSGRFNIDSFDSGYRASAGPWSSPSWGTPSFASLPYVNPGNALQTTGVTTVNPYVSGPSGGVSGTNPASANPYGSIPSSGGPTVTTHP